MSPGWCGCHLALDISHAQFLTLSHGYLGGSLRSSFLLSMGSLDHSSLEIFHFPIPSDFLGVFPFERVTDLFLSVMLGRPVTFPHFWKNFGPLLMLHPSFCSVS